MPAPLSSLQPPRLLRYMPRMLVVASFATMVLLWLGVSWRLNQAKEASLEQGARTTRAVAAAIAGSIDDTLTHTRQALFTAHSLTSAGTNADLGAAVEQRLGLQDQAFVVAVLDKQGRVLHLSGAAQDAQLRSTPVQSLSLEPTAVQWGKGTALAIAADVQYRGEPARVLLAYPADALRKTVHNLMQGAPGRVQVRKAEAGPALFDYIAEGYEPGGEQFEEVFSTEAGLRVTMSVPKSWALAYHYSSAVPATVAISMGMALITWSIFITAALGFKRALQAQKELTRLVALDPLTGLPNRRTFTNLLSQGLEASSKTKVPYGLMFIDLDNFKYVNDTHGHDAGDLLLKEISKRLSAAVRATDYVCRLGGDEFVVLLTALEAPRDAEEVARRILASLERPIHLGDTDLHMGASLGIALAPRDAQNSSQLVMCADMAVYRAKAEGKGRFAFFDPSLRAKAEARSKISNDIRRGIEAREFYLVYQPKVSLRTRETTGFEALLRWHHPRLGEVLPGEFIPIAEETGIIEQLGDRALELAVEQLRHWHDEGHGWQAIAVNVSARQLKDKTFVARIAGLLSSYEVPGRALQLELTESMLALDEVVAARVIRELKTLDVQVSVDDFGTGYSSLSALQRYDVDYLKIDRSFVADIETSADSLEICRAIVQMAHALKMQTIAEGIETPGQYAALKQLGCDEAQGYLLAKPMPHDDAVAWTKPGASFRDSAYALEA